MVAATIAALRPDLIEPFVFGLGAGLADGAWEPEIPTAALRITPASAKGALADGFDSRLRELRATVQK